MTPKRPGAAIVYLTLALTALLYLLAKPNLAVLGDNLFLSIAQLAALLGTVLFTFSFLLACRFSVLEDAYGGLDKVYRFHHKTGVWSFTFLAIHFLGLLITYLKNGIPIFTLMLTVPLYITGAVALFTMTIIILTIIFAKIPYQIFIFIQKLFAVPLAFGMIHLFTVTSDVSRYRPLGFWMAGVMIIGAMSWLYRELLYKWLAPHAAYEITGVINKGAGITEITMKPLGRRIKYQPGQFAYFSFRSRGVSSEPHPFSFSSSPDSNLVSFAAKDLGDFTHTLARAAAGDRVTVYGPHGRFFSDLATDAKNIFIAGGIGVTPFLSIVRGRQGFGQTILFYSTNSETDAVFEKELEDISERTKAFGMFFHESNRRGYLNADIIEKRAGGLNDKAIYLCGPAPMMKSLADGFLAKGVPRERIVFEEFSY